MVKDKALARNLKLEEEMGNLRLNILKERSKFDTKLKEEALKLKDEGQTKTKTIEFLVSSKAELETRNNIMGKDIELLQKEKCSLEQSVENLGGACSEMRMQVQIDGLHSEQIQNYKNLKEKEINALKELLLRKEESYRELQAKLLQVTSENTKAQVKLDSVSSEFEMCKVHLTQMRSSGGQELLNEKDSEISSLKSELAQTRTYLSDATMRIEKLTLEQDMMTEQYRNYSRDLANQSEKMAEQLKRHKEENMKLSQREIGLVQHVGTLETQMQRFIRGGKNVTEEEICRLKDALLSCETELRFAKDEKEKLQQMFTDSNKQAEDSSKKLIQKNAMITELRDQVSGLETTVEMLNSTSTKSCTDQAELLAACQSDKVAASMAMQQNVNLKQRLEELQGAVVSITNSKAELMDQLEDAKRSLSGFSSVEAKLSAMNETVKEKDIMSNNLKNNIKYLQQQLVNEGKKVEDEDTKLRENAAIKKDLEQSQESIRCLNSQISELQSKLEVLSSQTRECSESRSSSRFSDGRTGMVDTDSDSCDSYIEVESTKTTKDDSSESFIDLGGTHTPNVISSQTKDNEYNTETVTDASRSHCIDNIEALKQLERRFITAMDQLVELSSDKEQLEYLVERLQQETETVGDYVIMYQHQRIQQKLKIQEKEEEVRKLAKDREELQDKLMKLQGLVTNLVDNSKIVREKVSIEHNTEKSVDMEEKMKILELLTEIGTESGDIIARCEISEPWFWENSQTKVMTV
eukprot:GFUD01033693.1.p1 GENE.GFUD01033693.1~~GFUD01033693.1.p1  ORF type:complete len:866 (-),score=253.22 GFUD01033693.1:551-2803(-)